MKRIVFYTLLSLVMVVAPAEAKEKSEIRVVEVSQDADAANEGVVYSLPTTMLRIKVEAEVTLCKVGPFYRYSNSYLNLSDVVTEDSKTWKLLSATITSYGKASEQESQKYKIVAMNAVCPSVQTTSDGVLLGINTKCESVELCDEETDVELPELTFDDVQLDRSILTKTSTAAMAQETALSIYDLRDKRLSLLGGEDATVLHDAGSYEKVFAEIERLERDYISMFAGKKKTIKVVKYYDVVPDCYGATSQVLLRFSEKEGFLDAMDLNGKPVYVDMTFTKPTQVSSYSAQSKERRSKPIYGLRYIRPAMVNVKVVDRNKQIGEGNVLCSQGGQLLSLPAKVLTEKGVSVKFDSTNGALEYIKYNE